MGKGRKFVGVVGEREAVWASLLAAPFLAWLSQRIDLDLWCDEVYSLELHTFVPPFRTLVLYTDSNNHIFFNLLNHLLLWPFRLAFGLDLGVLMRHPWAIRLVPLAYTILLFVVLYATAVRYLDRECAPIAVILLGASIPCYNYCLQIRGYGLSMLLLSLLVYFLWSDARRRNLAGVTAGAALLIYTIPTNALFVGSLGLASLCAMAASSPPARGGHRKRFAALAAGTGLGALGYLPAVLHKAPTRDNMFVSHLQRGVAPDYAAFHLVMARMFKANFADQWLLIAVLALAGVLLVFRRSVPAAIKLRGKFAQLTIALLAPFGPLFVFGISEEFDTRILAPATPLFVLLFAAAFALVYEGIPVLKRAPRVLLVALFLYFNIGFYLNVKLMDQRALADIAGENVSQNLSQNFFQNRYCLSATMAQLQVLLQRDAIPVVLFGSWGIAASYLQAYRIPFTGCDWVTPPPLADFKKSYGFDRPPRFYVLTIFPALLAAEIHRDLPEYRFTRVNPRPDFHSLFLVERRDAVR
jgi:hypothetical protein